MLPKKAKNGSRKSIKKGVQAEKQAKSELHHEGLGKFASSG